MKIGTVRYREQVIAFFCSEDAAEHLKQLEDDFLDDPEEQALFEVLFPEEWGFILSQVNGQLGWRKSHPEAF